MQSDSKYPSDHPLSVFRFHLQFRPRFSDLDPLGQVGNARIFTYFQEARMAYLARLGLFLPNTSPTCLTVVSDTCRYQAPVRHHHLLQVHLRSADWGRRSFSFHYALWLPEEDVLAAKGTTRVQCYDPMRRKSTGLPEGYLERMRLFEQGELDPA